MADIPTTADGEEVDYRRPSQERDEEDEFIRIPRHVYLPLLIKSGRVILELKKLKGKGKNRNM